MIFTHHRKFHAFRHEKCQRRPGNRIRFFLTYCGRILPIASFIFIVFRNFCQSACIRSPFCGIFLCCVFLLFLCGDKEFRNLCKANRVYIVCTILTGLVQDYNITDAEGMHCVRCRPVIAVEFYIQALKAVFRAEIPVIDIPIIVHCERDPGASGNDKIHEAVLISRSILFNLVDRIAVHVPLCDVSFHFIKDL